MDTFIEVVVNLPIPQTFTYKAPLPKENSKKTQFEPQIGVRAEVPFGSRKLTAFVINTFSSLPDNFPVTEDKIKNALRILDENPLFTVEHINLAKWISYYYICSLGEALATMLPSGKRDISTKGFSFEEDSIDSVKRTLSEEQQLAVKGILSSDDFHYLYGPTGTGKTEVFLQASDTILKKGKGVIYLVPEIGLTHQVIEAVISRFGKTAAVLHSGLTPSQKLYEWHRILNKEARVVIGARSAIFAPVPDLGLIIIDEEHDASYKSGTTPRYHARQVAMRRCTDLHIPLLMGSATPSVESWYAMQQGTIHKHVLSKRLSGGVPPEILLVNLTKETDNTGCISTTLEEEIRKTHEMNRQTILFINRRGFTHFFKCNSCGYELKCKNCSVSLTYHKSENLLRCHYCGWSIKPPTQCPDCNSLDIMYSGYGTEFIETEIKTKFPSYNIDRIDTDSIDNAEDLQQKLTEFRNGKIDILLGTQMVAKGLNFPNLRLVGVISADVGLHMPDFRASERTFSLITQVAGRAGRFFPDGKVIVQSFNVDHEAIQFSCNSDVDGFYENEIEQRQILEFPPFSRMIRLVFRSANSQKSYDASDCAVSIIKEFAEKNSLPMEVLGPAESPLFMVAKNYRHQVLLRSNSIQPLQKAAAHLLYQYKPIIGVYLEIDVDPISLL